MARSAAQASWQQRCLQHTPERESRTHPCGACTTGFFVATLPHRVPEGQVVGRAAERKAVPAANTRVAALGHHVAHTRVGEPGTNPSHHRSQTIKTQRHQHLCHRTHSNKSAQKGRPMLGLMRRVTTGRAWTHMRVAGGAVRQRLLPTWRKSCRQDKNKRQGL
jgi:hypothetical protein